MRLESGPRSVKSPASELVSIPSVLAAQLAVQQLVAFRDAIDVCCLLPLTPGWKLREGEPSLN